jgi:hypothetical protein
MGWDPDVPPTRDPKDCICGGMSGDRSARFDVVCPCCDGIWWMKRTAPTPKTEPK